MVTIMLVTVTENSSYISASFTTFILSRLVSQDSVGPEEKIMTEKTTCFDALD